MSPSLKRVGVVGAGVSGVVAAAHLRAAGLEVTVFERSAVAGGVWLFDSRLPPEPSYPALVASIADNSVGSNSQLSTRIENGKSEVEPNPVYDLEILHAPPGPCYEGLSNNVPTTVMKLKLNSWKPGTAQYVNHSILAAYIQDTSSKSGVDECIRYNTCVNRVTKKDNKWQVQTATLEAKNVAGDKITTNFWEFDSLVVASGHYHTPRIPDIPGLKQWKRLWPDRIEHSKRYRSPNEYKNQTVLLIGASVSSTDIARELGSIANTIYQASRGGPYDMSDSLLPGNAKRVGEAISFNLFDTGAFQDSNTLLSSQPIPATVTLVTGEVLENIDRVIMCTGYHFSLPFLSEYHRDDLPVEDADDIVLVTDGSQMHNLHKDIFYIPDPTLTFIGVPYHVATFTVFEFQAITAAAVFSGKVKLPTEENMRQEYLQKVAEKGYGRPFNSLMGQDVDYPNTLIDWLNKYVEDYGERFEGHPPEWLLAYEDFRIVLGERLAQKVVV